MISLVLALSIFGQAPADACPDLESCKASYQALRTSSRAAILTWRYAAQESGARLDGCRETIGAMRLAVRTATSTAFLPPAPPAVESSGHPLWVDVTLVGAGIGLGVILGQVASGSSIAVVR